MTTEITMPLVTLFWMALIGWIVWVISEGRHRKRKMEAISDFQNRLLERIGTAEEFGRFLESDAWRQFLGAVEPRVGISARRIIGSTQTGTILTLLGIALVVLGFLFPFDEPVMPILGVIVLSLGVGFLVSAFLAFRLSKSLGLLEEPGRPTSSSGPV
jgi:hypothetical protein